MARWVAIGVASWAVAAWAVVPVNGTTPAFTPVAVSTTGDSFDPHVSGDLVAYTQTSTIHYYRFSTGVDSAIAQPSGATDLLSDTDGTLVVFSRVLSDRTAVYVFDTGSATATEIDPAAGVFRFGAVVGGGTLAYIDTGLASGGELIIHDLASNTSQRITNDTAADANPSVSPDGTVVVWQHCPTGDLTLCDIWQAVKSGSSWTVSTTHADPAQEEFPDTNGSLVVYDSDRPTGLNDIFYMPVTGGTETEVEIPGIQINPNMAGKYTAFESRSAAGQPGDIYLYDISGNTLYQITNTPTLNEELDDMTVLADGSVRLVWDNDEAGATARHVYAATFAFAAAGGGTGGGTGGGSTGGGVGGGSGGGGGGDDCDPDEEGDEHGQHHGDVDHSGWHRDHHGHFHHGHGHQTCNGGGDGDGTGHGNGQGNGNVGHSGQSLSSSSEQPGAVGCSGVGGAPWLALAALALLLLGRRPQPVPVPAKKR